MELQNEEDEQPEHEDKKAKAQPLEELTVYQVHFPVSLAASKDSNFWMDMRSSSWNCVGSPRILLERRRHSSNVWLGHTRRSATKRPRCVDVTADTAFRRMKLRCNGASGDVASLRRTTACPRPGAS